MKLMKKIRIVLLLVATLVVVGCADKKPFIPQHPKASLEERRAYYVAELEKNDVQVIHIGQEIRIVFRDDFIFIPDSANLNESAKPVLDWAAKLMATYTKINVKVAGYLDNQGKRPFLQALSKRQAEVVSNYLWDQGVDARLMYSVGYNQLKPVDWNGSLKGRSFNRRVEISFRYYPRYKGYE